MPTYKAPLKDIQFLLNDVYNADQHYQALGYSEVNRELVDAILTEGAKFAEQELDTCRAIGDEVGSKLVDGKVVTPPGFKEAYNAYCENGWAGMCFDEQYGGQGLPHSLGIVFHEMIFSANVGWCGIGTLTHGAIRAIDAHGNDDMKAFYLPRLVTGEWTGTMCLTESHAGSDVGLVKTKAEANDDGSFSITGTKIFITQGEHDFADNIIHLVLARLPGAPKGPKGISLFLVPKFIPNADGSLADRNAVVCSALEKKMGLKSSPTSVLNFDGAQGWLIGNEHAGLAAMFTMMNSARLDVGVEGLAATELSFQGALEYAKDRLQMRAPTGAAAPEKEADPIIVHPDVRRMLLTQKAFAEGGRALAYLLGLQLDVLAHGDAEQKKDAKDLVALLTPINKAFLTDRGLEAANLGVQVFGGHGYITEHGMEQIVRDVRISSLYEGTNGIQANDLVGRKLVANGGALLRKFLDRIQGFCDDNAGNADLAQFIQPLSKSIEQWWSLANVLMTNAKDDPNFLGAAAVDFLEYSGYVTYAYLWAQMALVAQTKLAAGEGELSFYDAKIKTAQFYYQRLLPRTHGLAVSMQAGADCVMSMDVDQFSF
ncbi:MAG: acyl-CoA dehydrogenase [Moraxellaceae bacterium]|nr:MAG: acyl-CoA dehydrogenase [Moraxellaceae bacterium]